MKKLIPVLIALALAYLGIDRWRDTAIHGSQATTRSEQSSDVSPPLESGSSAEPRAGAQLESEGTVVRVLPDDTKGSRHQRFLVQLPSGRTVLIAHNIDLAPRVEGLAKGDTVSFSGEFENNERGGVVHWTHHDPSGRHVAGWIRHQGRTYQ